MSPSPVSPSVLAGDANQSPLRSRHIITPNAYLLRDKYVTGTQCVASPYAGWLAGTPACPVLVFLEGEKAALFERSGYVDDGRARYGTLNHTYTHARTHTHTHTHTHTFKRSHESANGMWDSVADNESPRGMMLRIHFTLKCFIKSFSRHSSVFGIRLAIAWNVHDIREAKREAEITICEHVRARARARRSGITHVRTEGGVNGKADGIRKVKSSQIRA